MAQSPNFTDYGKYKWFNAMSNEFEVCYKEYVIEANSNWQTSNPLMKHMPIFTLQLSVLILFTRVFALIFRPLHQPYFLPEILAGIVLGPSVMANVASINIALTPFEGALFLETMANLGVTFYMFLVGLEMDLAPIRKIGKTALSVAIAGIIFPMCAGAASHYLVWRNQEREKAPFHGFWFWAIALSVTSFPDLARMLSDLKLMHTDLGKTALSAAVVSDLSSWLLLVGTISLMNGKEELAMAIPNMVCMTTLWFLLRPAIAWVVRQTAMKKADPLTGCKYNDKHVYFILSAVLLCGFLTELCGAHSMFGAFMFGLMIPSGDLGTLVMEKIEEFVVGILLPPTFLITGTRTSFQFVFADISPAVVLVAILLACSAKVVSTLLVCLFFRCPTRDSWALGLLMNTKGVLVLIVLNEARNIKVLDQQTFACMILAILLMTVVIGPVLSYTYDKSGKHMNKYYRRNLERSKPETPLRILACVHSHKNLSGLFNLLTISNATRKSPITVFALHLVELAGRATAMLIFHDKVKKVDNIGNNATREKAAAEQIMSAFELFEEENHAVSIQPLTAVSPYATMHEDVSSFALDKATNIILIPFHRQTNALGGWVDENLQHREVNKNLLATAPCSVGLLVDRGITLPTPDSENWKNGRRQDFHVCMLFVEGCDDREALAYAWRIAATPYVILTVVRFIPAVNDDACDENSTGSLPDYDDDTTDVFSTMLEREKEKQIDYDYINEFRFKTMHDQSIIYFEKQVEGGDQIVSIITSVYSNFDLYIVGRSGQGRTSSLTSGLSNWTDYPELGPLGETLISVDSESPASVLIVQQSPPPTSSKSKNFAANDGIFGNGGNSPALETFVNHRRISDDDY